MKLYIIGAGGTASYLLPVLARTLTRECAVSELIIIDRDKLEEKNVERQLYDYADIGKSKAEVVAAAIQPFSDVPVTIINDWFTESFEMEPGSFIISCTDNHPARLALLNVCDVFDCKAVICGNETFSADAYYYEPSFKGKLLDPRIRYPEIVTDKQDDPTRPPCNDADALAANPQLAAANSMSANFGMQLTQLWLFEIGIYDLKQVMDVLPVEYSSHKTGINVTKFKTLNKEKENE
jgi:molybdopterin/thiamine biosynthesis adenylyltransferase